MKTWDVRKERPGIGGTQKSFLRGGSAPKSDPGGGNLWFYMLRLDVEPRTPTVFDTQGTHFVTFDKW